MDRLAIQAGAWLASDDPQTKAAVFALLSQAAATGADPLATLRDGLRRWFGADAAAMLRVGPTHAPGVHTPSPNAPAPETIALEPLSAVRGPTLWPQRPKRLVGELFSSWLWRSAAAGGVAPPRFVTEVLGPVLGEIDREIAPETLGRLARLSGQAAEHLAAGTLPRRPEAPQDCVGGMIEDTLLRDERFLLTRAAHRSDGRERPTLAYCPGCLGSDARPHFRRSWRFAPFVVCVAHRALLLDRCWRCEEPVSLFQERAAHGRPIAGARPRCWACDALFSAAPTTSTAVAAKLVPRQRNLAAMLGYLVTDMPAAERVGHLDRLAAMFRPNEIQARVSVLAELQPSTAQRWFGLPVDERHDAPLQLLSEGVMGWKGVLATARRRRLVRGQSASAYAAAPGSVAIYRGKLWRDRVEA